jgi:ABC-type multidrug transport system fused ATPase/permease subunit
VSQLYDQGQYVNDMFDVLNTKPKIIQPAAAVKLEIHTAPTIEFRNVSFRYPGSENYILRHFSLRIEPGQKIAFVGENGAGTSQKLHLKLLLQPNNQGLIQWLKSYRRNMIRC